METATRLFLVAGVKQLLAGIWARDLTLAQLMATLFMLGRGCSTQNTGKGVILCLSQVTKSSYFFWSVQEFPTTPLGAEVM